MASYRALVGIDYPPNKRAEAGEVINDLPAQSAKWLLEMGLIEDSSKPVKKSEPKAEEPVVVEEPIIEEPVAEPVVEEAPVAPAEVEETE
jgi:hypothetical protein